MENRDFCIFCRKETMYEIKEIKRSRFIKEKEYTYQSVAAYCKECGEEMLIPGMLDQDTMLFDLAYRKANALILITDINKIVQKYALSESMLSLVLGFEKDTITNYIQGQMPLYEHSQVLKEVLINPKYMMQLLDGNSDKISALTYQKALSTIETVMLEKQEKVNKMEQVIQYLLHGINEITPLALQKLLYFAQGLFLAKYNTYLFAEDCQAWLHGPVYPSVYKKYQQYGYEPIIDVDNEPYTLLPQEKEILDLVVETFGMHSGKELETITHHEPPWLETYIEVESLHYVNQTITKKRIQQYFRQICLEYGMQEKEEVERYIQTKLSS